MYFKQILNEDSGCSSYVIASRQSKEAVVVDPALDVAQYLELARRRQFRTLLVIDTHIHADHISGARKLAAATGAEVAMHESADVLFPFRKLRDGEVIDVGQLRLAVWHTPGHRPEAISILVKNPPRGDYPSMVLTGDSLFVGDVGRPDFGGAAGSRQQYGSVHRLLELGDFVEVFPAHFEGSCGKGMCGRPSSTIGFERRYNPLVQLGEADFVDATSEPPARPLNMTSIVAMNRGEGDFTWAEPRLADEIREMDSQEAAAWLAREKAVVLDVREPEEYEQAHIAGARLMPQSELAGEIDRLDKNDKYLVVCSGGVRSLRATHYLTALGFGNAVSLKDGTNGWLAAGLPAEGRDAAAAAAVASSSTEPERYIHAGG
jgi:glyoxylase-like metal-dependent hydrolase (beta-lactamase superfamily II)/rhodanese-related sulfurtransferase